MEILSTKTRKDYRNMAITTKNSNFITLGSGILQFQPYTATEADQFQKLIDFGSQKDTIIKSNRAKQKFEEGTPKQTVVEDVTSEEVTIESSFAEMSPEEIVARLGFGTITDQVADASADEEEYKTLSGTAFEMLYGKGTLTSVVVTSLDATPVTYTLSTDGGLTGDYLMGTKEGSAAIRRTSASTIEDGEQVKVSYTWSKPAMRYIGFGGSATLQYYHMRHVKNLRDGKRVIHDFWKVGPGGANEFNFTTDNYGVTKVTFTALADSSKTEGEQFYRVYYEEA